MTIELIVSETVQYENSRNPYPLRRQWVERCLAMAASKQSLDENIFHRALEFERNGIHAVDALHLACAEAAQCDYFITCDDRVVRRYTGLEMRAINPVHFILTVTGD